MWNKLLVKWKSCAGIIEGVKNCVSFNRHPHKDKQLKGHKNICTKILKKFTFDIPFNCTTTLPQPL